VSAGGDHTCARTTGGAAYCWGDSRYGQLGNGTTVFSNSDASPTAVLGGHSFAALSSTGFSHTCAFTGSGATYCWGHNAYGQLGNGTTTDASTPASVSGGLSFAALSAGGDHTCGRTTSGSVYCWGFNPSGQLGDGTTTGSTVPVKVSGQP
jgi:alpha-tubulin suppressor-like RCC1 family protein